MLAGVRQSSSSSKQMTSRCTMRPLLRPLSMANTARTLGPSATVAANLTELVNNPESTVQRVQRGYYGLESTALHELPAPVVNEAQSDAEEMGLINAFGMFWNRAQVFWRTSMPHLLGVQLAGSQPVNFTAQAGIYILHDSNRPIYVGRVVEPRLGPRLFEHTRDRLTGRCDRFSWFGVRSVGSEGQLNPSPSEGISVGTLIATMEALMIEGLEPPQNRRQGDGFNAVEFIQVPDPEIETARKKQLLGELMKQAAG